MSNLVRNEQVAKIISTPRIPAIDFVRGMAIILMALDHASTYWNIGKVGGAGLTSWSDDPTAIVTRMARNCGKWRPTPPRRPSQASRSPR